jgi:hypothetical protein
VASALLEPSESKRPVSQALLSHANRSLTGTLTLRAIEQRYRGSMLGVLWAFLTPLFMLLIYTFVFGVVFQSRWGSGTGSTVEFAIILFAGITTFTLFSEVVSSAPALITGQPNLVKKIVFPLEILPLVSLGGALFQALIAYVVVLALQIGLGSGFHLVFSGFRCLCARCSTTYRAGGHCINVSFGRVFSAQRLAGLAGAGNGVQPHYQCRGNDAQRHSVWYFARSGKFSGRNCRRAFFRVSWLDVFPQNKAWFCRRFMSQTATFST